VFPFIFPGNQLVLVGQVLCKTISITGLDRTFGLRQVETPRISR